MAGLLNAEPVSNRIHYRLARRKCLEALAETLPKHYLDWSRLLTFLTSARRLAKDAEHKSPRVTVVAASELFRNFETSLAGFQQPSPNLESSTEHYWEDAVTWILRFTEDLAKGLIPK
jgi:hypothetical protein